MIIPVFTVLHRYLIIPNQLVQVSFYDSFSCAFDGDILTNLAKNHTNLAGYPQCFALIQGWDQRISEIIPSKTKREWDIPYFQHNKTIGDSLFCLIFLGYHGQTHTDLAVIHPF